MIRLLISRLLWSIPTLAGIYLLVFAAVTFLPDSRERGAELAAHRAHFLDLPRFYNGAPVDVATRTDALLLALAGDNLQVAAAEAELARIGGAALPHILPRFNQQSPALRQRIAVALVPVAIRMGKFDPAEFDTPDRAVTFWARFWEDHAIDFTPISRRRGLARLVAHGGLERERELRLLDTYLLEDLVPLLAQVTRRDSLTQLTELASRATAQPLRIPDNAGPAQITAVVAAWQNYWFIYQTDYIALDAPDRLIASLSATRYGRWLVGSVTGRLTTGAPEQISLGERLRRRFFVTLGLIVAALLGAVAFAVPLGVWSAYRRGRAVDRVVALFSFLAYSIPSFALSQALATSTGAARAVAAAAVLALGMLAAMTRTQRSAMLEILSSDYIRTARAKGLSEARVLIVHALRNSIMPVVALASIQFPALLGGALVVEEAFGLQGLGWETLRALTRNDLPWVVIAVLTTATLVTLALLLADVLYLFVDPRALLRGSQRSR